MPLHVQVKRDGETLMVENGWSYFHLSCVFTAAIKDADPTQEFSDIFHGDSQTFADIPDGQWLDFSMVPIYYLDMPTVPLVTSGEQTLTEDYKFEGPYLGEWFELKAGDILIAHRVDARNN